MVGDVTVVESDFGVQLVKFPFALTGPHLSPVTIKYKVLPGSAAKKADFKTKNGTVTFRTGEVARSVYLSIVGDALVEPNESFVVQVKKVAGAGTVDGTGIVTLTDNDANGVSAFPEVSAGRVTMLEGAAGNSRRQRIVDVPITLSRPWSLPLTVAAEPELDCDHVNVTFSPGQTTGWVPVTVDPNTVPNGNRVFRYHLTLQGAQSLVKVPSGYAALVDEEQVASLGKGNPLRASEPANRFDAWYAPVEHCHDSSQFGSLSSDGRYAAFQSGAMNLVPGDTNRKNDVFVKDLTTDAVERVSVTSAGAQANDDTNRPQISPDGRYVVFETYARNLVPASANGRAHVAVYDRTTKTLDPVASALPFDSAFASISADGRYVALQSNDAVPGDVDPCLPVDGCAGRVDVYVVDRTTDQVTLVTDGQGGAPQMGWSPQISADGRSIAYTTYSPGTQPQNREGYETFVTDWTAGTTELVSVNSAEQRPQGSGVFPWSTPALSADGRTIAFIASTCNWGVTCHTQRPDGVFHVYVRDRDAGTTTVVSTGPTPQTPPFLYDVGLQPSISADGRYVAFNTDDPKLKPAGWNANVCGGTVYLRDRVTGTATVVSSMTNGACALSGTGEGQVDTPGGLSADGRSVAFTGRTRYTVNDLVGAKADVFVKRVR